MNEKFSALMDGELDHDEAARVIKSLGADEAQRESWDAYHLIGACMRGETASDRSLQRARTDAIFSKLAAEPTVLAPSALRRLAGEKRTRMALAMAASIVTISAVGVVALKQQDGVTVAPVQLVQQAAPQPVLVATQPLRDAGELRKAPDVRFNDYLVIHRQFANPGAIQPASLVQHREKMAEPVRQSAVR